MRVIFGAVFCVSPQGKEAPNGFYVYARREFTICMRTFEPLKGNEYEEHLFFPLEEKKNETRERYHPVNDIYFLN